MSCASLPHARRHAPLMSTGLTGKGYDPTKAAREERDRREKRHQEAMAKREEKERAACTFKPAVSRRSVELLQTVHKERPALHSPFSHRTPAKGSYKGQIAQGKPQISEVSKMLVAARDRQGPIYERLIQEGEETKRLRELAVEEHARQEASTVVGKPTIDPVSAALVQKKKDERGETVDRLSHAHVEQKKETIKRLEDEKNMQLAVEVEYKVFTNAKSKQLAKKLEATGNTSKHRMYASASGQSAAVGASQKFPDASSSPKSKGGSLSDGSPRPASAPQHRQSVSGSLSARSPSSASLRPLASTRPAADAKSSESVGASLDLITDVETLRAEFERLVAQREEAAGKAVAEMEAAVARAGEKTAKLTEEIAVLKTKNRELQLENQTLHQDKKLLLAEVETLSLRQKVCVLCECPHEQCRVLIKCQFWTWLRCTHSVARALAGLRLQRRSPEREAQGHH